MNPFLIMLALAWLALINSGSFVAFAIDKQHAMQGRWRVPERDLLNLAMLGGTVGALLGQQLLRHKTRKQPFRGRLIAVAVCQIALMAVVAGALLAQPRL